MLLDEGYIDGIDKHSAKKYEGETIYRIIAIVTENKRPQMYTIAIGGHPEDDPDNSNAFEPIIKSARYATEESIVFLDEHVANKFLTRFISQYGEKYEGDYNLKKFHVSEYNPFREILNLIPIYTPISGAYVTEQKIEEKPYDKKDEDED